LDQEPLLYDLRPTRGQVLTALWAALLLLVAFLAVLPFRSVPLARLDSFIPLFNNTVLLGDWITAALFFAQAAVLRSKALIALGTGYFFTGLMVIPHALAFPFAFAPPGLLPGGPNNTVWLYIFWHVGLPVSVMAFTLLKNAPGWPHTAWLSPQKAVAASMMGATALAGVLTLLATMGDAVLPGIMSSSFGWDRYKAAYATAPVMLLIAATIALSWSRKSSVLDLWLMLVLWGWFLELVLTTLTADRYSAGWYTARMLGLVSGLFVLMMLLVQTSRLYGTTILQIRARQLERENRTMIGDAIAASIAHELRQPLSAILLNAQTLQRHMSQSDGFASAILDDIAADGRRAVDIVASTRALSGKSTPQRMSIDINQLVRDTLVMASRDFPRLGVLVDLRLADHLPSAVVNPVQIQQVLFNLFTNAAEAMASVTDGPRMLTIRSGRSENGVVIRVEDTGPGIAPADQERIFETFYTTKPEGTGLGLSICRSIIAAHGGELRVMTKAPTGASFEITLPCSGAGETAAQTGLA
jgi:signal transduction histidine kinase